MTNERLYFFQFPTPFPTFVQKKDPGQSSEGAMAVDKGKAPEASSPEKRVSFAQDTKPAEGNTATGPTNVDSETEPNHVDGLIGQLEIYQSGAVKMRLHNGILLDVCGSSRIHLPTLLSTLRDVAVACTHISCLLFCRSRRRRNHPSFSKPSTSTDGTNT